MRYRFPPDFTRGAATVALQIEGAPAKHVRDPSRRTTYRDACPKRFWEGTSPTTARSHHRRLDRNTLRRRRKQSPYFFQQVIANREFEGERT